jgi:hypothetical protein
MQMAEAAKIVFATRFRCHPEERSDEGSLFMRQFEQHHRSRATPFRGSELQLRNNRRRVAPSFRGVFSASLLAAENALASCHTGSEEESALLFCSPPCLVMNKAIVCSQ